MNPSPAQRSLNVDPFAAADRAADLRVLVLWGAGGLLLLLLAPLLARWLCRALGRVRPNFRGDVIPASVGLTFLLVGGAVYAALATNRSAFAERAPVFLLVTLGFGLFGLIDDLWGTRAMGGFRGHLRSLLRGHPTTGGLKMIGGGLLAMLAAYFVHGGDAAVARGAPSSLLPHLVGVLRDALVIALAANALNLLDVRPGRALFGFALLALPTFVIVALTGSVSGGALLGAVALAVAIEAWPDARGRAMMGDTGSNLLGAVAGLAAVIELPVWARVVLLVLLAALNITAERVSLSQIIEKTSWLRALDRSLGVR